MANEQPDHLAEIDQFYTQMLKNSGTSSPEVPPLAPDYKSHDFKKLPAGVSGSSFGCGNPVAMAGV